MPLDGVIFDLDGTLVDTNSSHVDAWVEGLALHGYAIPAGRIRPEIGKGGDLLLPTVLGPDIPDEEQERIRASVADVFRRLAGARRFRVFDGAVPLLDALGARGLQLALATSASEDDLDSIMRSAGIDLREHFDAVVTKSDVERSKPAPDVIDSAVRKLGLTAAQCAMVGDTPYDAIAARRAGVVTLGVLSGGLEDETAARARLVTSGARGTWREVGHLLAEIDEALHLASPLKLRLTRARQEELMRVALDAAREGMARGEAPIGCVIADASGEPLVHAWNEMWSTGSKVAHAEIVAFTKGAGVLPPEARDLILVSTLEPCVMCTGAAMVGAVDTILFALRAPADSGSGRVTPPESPESQMPRIVGGILDDESRSLVQEWLDNGAEEPQASYGRQLLALT